MRKWRKSSEASTKFKSACG